jgi:hypothetical protein
MIPLRSVKISGHVSNLAVKCHATENIAQKTESGNVNTLIDKI